MLNLIIQLNKQMMHLRTETIITVSVKGKIMKIVMRVFGEKNVKDSGDYKLIKEPAKLKSTFGEREL